MSTGVTPIDETKMLRDISEEDRMGWPARCFKELDVAINVWFLRGHLGETISSHASRAAELNRRWGIWMCKFLDLFDKNHGPNAQAGDTANAEAVIAIEEGSGNLPDVIKVKN